MNIIVINFNCRIDILTNCNTQIKKKKKKKKEICYEFIWIMK